MSAATFEIQLVPVGLQGYELYCEIEAQPVVPVEGTGGGIRGRLARTFHDAVTYVENERHKREDRAHLADSGSRLQRERDRMMAWIAERVAEQRLLWHLRTEHTATVHHPDDLTQAEAADIVMASLQRDARRHAVWMSVDACGGLAMLPLAPLPGPNLPGYYFTFRAVGHLLSTMGARHGMRRVVWKYVPSAEMTDLRACASLDPAARDAIAHRVAARLNLPHLATFVERMTAVKPVL